MTVLGDLIDDKTVWHINPTGNFVIGGPDGDTGTSIDAKLSWIPMGVLLLTAVVLLVEKIPKSR